MFGLKGYLYAGLAVALLAFVGRYAYLERSNATQQATIHGLEANISTMRVVAERNAEARAVAEAHIRRFEAMERDRFTPLVEDVLREGTNDIPEHPSTIAIFERLRTNP